MMVSSYGKKCLMGDVKRAEKKLEKARASLNEFLALQERFPDLDFHIDRQETRRYTSQLANELVNEVQITNSCGCCSDSVIYAWPFVVINGVKVYSNPARYDVGENCINSGTIPWHDWAKKLVDLPPIITEKIQKYFDENPERYDDDD